MSEMLGQQRVAAAEKMCLASDVHPAEHELRKAKLGGVFRFYQKEKWPFSGVF
jgi:hypothetical protein